MVHNHQAAILVLNYNGRDLLEECLPSVITASEHASIPCRVIIVDNSSTDGSLKLLHEKWPNLPIFHKENQGLASFNSVLDELDEELVILLNNDVKLDSRCIDLLQSALRSTPQALFAAPKCWDFKGTTYEGMRTRVRMTYGLVQGLCRVPGFEAEIDKPSLTASAGPILAVDRKKFLEIGGYDTLYRPGRIEDLDLGFRAWKAGYQGIYVPEAVAYHQGFGSFGPAFGRRGCDQLALRNTLLFCWKNLSGLRLVRHCGWLVIRAIRATLFARIDELRAFLGALIRLDEVIRARKFEMRQRGNRVARQELFFQEFGWESR